MVRSIVRVVAVEFGSALEAAIRDAVVDIFGRRDVWVAIAALSPASACCSSWVQLDNPDGELMVGTTRPPTHAEIAAEIGRIADALRAESWRAR